MFLHLLRALSKFKFSSNFFPSLFQCTIIKVFVITKLFNSVLENIEITSLINLKSITSDLNCTVILKLESKKSGDNIKCRIYLLQLTKLND